MSQIAGLNDKPFVAEQYCNSGNLNIRIHLHQRFSTNKYGWHRWVFGRLCFPAASRILELGCGTGELWLENLDRIPGGWEITLSDLSAGMVRQARQNLGGNHRFRFEVVDAQCIPYADRSLDGVIANHMLYHVPDRGLALAEIHRVLRPGGRFVASTVGRGHLHEIADLLGRFDPGLIGWGTQQTHSFVLENGADQLAASFAGVTLARYEDALLVTKPAPLIEYILSGTVKLTAEQQQAFARFVAQEFERREGTFAITKDSGVFAARRP